MVKPIMTRAPIEFPLYSASEAYNTKYNQTQCTV